jgi:anti-sigma factor RsiW
LTRIWAERGSRPRAPRDQRYDWAYLFGAVCPARDAGAALVLPVADGEAMNLHLAEISRMRYTASMSLRRRVEMMLPSAPPRATNRRSVLKGFVMGTALSTALAASLVVAVIRTDRDQRLLDDLVSAHVRSLQGDHLTDVQTSDQHTVKPWFNGKVDLAPPVVDLTAQGFRLIGGRLDYIDGKTVASIVYLRRKHVINLFVAPAAGPDHRETKETIQGFNIRRWSAHGFEFSAVSDLNAEELQEFVDKLDAAVRAATT